MARPVILSLGVALALALGCQVAAPGSQAPHGHGAEGTEGSPGAADPASATPGAQDAARAEPPPAPYKPPSTLAAPVEIREAGQTLHVRASPARDGLERGRIPRGERFHVYATREGPGCKRAWAEIADAAWVCLERTSVSDEDPRNLPALEPGAIVPFIYARHPNHDDLRTPPLPVYDSASAYRSGAAPIDTLPAYGSYAFTRIRGSKAEPLLVTQNRDVVPGAALELFEPSEFEGRDLQAEPVPEGRTLAWAVRWKTEIRAAPDPSAPARGRVKYHHTMLSVGEAVLGPEGEPWFEILAAGERPAGFVLGEEIRRFMPEPPPGPVLAGQVTLDIDLAEQVMSVWIEDRPVFATLISSGKVNDRTPLGIYRIETKQAYGKMQSLASARDPYYVDAVPWTMYFKGRYALHTSYWHDMFGHRMSHGCVNLSPRDAKRVFELVGPRLPEGWLVVHEHAADPGAVVRIRRGDAEVPDLRGPVPGESPKSDGASG